MKVSDLMSTDLFTLHADQMLGTAEDIMGWQNVRHIPVVEKDRLVGVVTQRDLLQASLSKLANVSAKERHDLLNRVRVRDVMTKKVITIGPDDDLRDAAALMIDEKIGCLPVIQAKRLVGIITEADFLTLAWDETRSVHRQKEFTTVRKYQKPRSPRSTTR
jgi:CBS domain-containing membrane protein